jgi:hypothetical protein
VNRLRFPFTFALISLLSIAAFAQPQTPAVTAEEKEKQKKKEELEQKAYVMLDELIEERRGFRLPENRWWILLSAANLLWERDEKQARELFSEATIVYTQFASQIDSSPDTFPEQLLWQIQNMRVQTVQLIAPRDPQLASDFLVATRRSGDAENRNPGLNEQESQLEMMLAQHLANNNPQRALQRAEEMLAAGKPIHVVGSLLYSIRERDFDAAQKLANQLIAKLQAEDQLSIESTQFASTLIMFGPPPNSEEPSNTNIRPRPLITSAQTRLLIEKVNAATQAELAAAKKQNDMNRRHNVVNLLNQLKSMTPYIEKYAPNLLPAIKRSWAESEQIMEPSQRHWATFNQISEKGSIDQLLEAAPKAPPEMQAQYYQRAAQIAITDGNPDRARQIVKDNVRDSAQRAGLLQELDQQQLLQQINAGKFEDAQRLLGSLRTKFERVNMLIQMASAAQSSNRKEIAVKILDDAWTLIGGPPESSQQFSAQLNIAGAYLPLDTKRSFEIIEGTIDKYNEVFAASALLGSFEWQGTFREKEMILASGDSSLAQQYAPPLATLAAVDLERVQSFLQRCGSADMRANLTLMLLRQLLSQSSSRGGFGYGSSKGRGMYRLH